MKISVSCSPNKEKSEWQGTKGTVDMSDVCDYFKLSCLLPSSGGKIYWFRFKTLENCTRNMQKWENHITTGTRFFLYFNHKYGNNKKSNKIARLSNAACSICVWRMMYCRTVVNRLESAAFASVKACFEYFRSHYLVAVTTVISEKSPPGK